jgi:7-cyano-7-deazaguanine synthase
VNSVDYSNYPDCRAGFIKSFAETVRLGTCAVDDNWKWVIHTPLQDLSKAQIIQLGVSLGVDYSLTTSCYDPDSNGRSCGKCDSCRLRHQGFLDAGVPDPTLYV